jgi:hypothetical protein
LLRRVVAVDPSHRLTLGSVSWPDRYPTVSSIGLCGYSIIQPQSSFTGIRIRPMALKTGIGQEGPDIAIEADRPLRFLTPKQAG